MLWIKAFHVIFVVTWFAGLFYLPRLYVYHAEITDESGHRRFVIMERRLFIMMTLGGGLAALFGLALLWRYGGLGAAQWRMGWWHAKLLGVAALIGYHIACHRLMVAFREGRNTRSHRWYRWFNEIPTLLLIAIVVLVVVKPF